MFVFSNPLALLLAIPLCGLAVLIWRDGYLNLSPRRKLVALIVRLVVLLAIVLGLAGVSLRWPQTRESTVFVADLSASDAASRSSIAGTINAALAQRPGDDQAGIVSFGRQALVEQPVSALDSFDGFQSPVDSNYSNLEGGLELAHAVLPSGYRQRVVLLSDGQQNVGDALMAARLLRAQGVRVDVSPVGVRSGPEVLVDRVDVPSQLRPDEHFSLAVSLHSTVATMTGLDVYRDHALVMTVPERVQVGENRFLFSQTPLQPGFHTYQVHITPAIDTLPQNNTGSASTSVQQPPRVLVIAADPLEAGNILASLRSTGIKTDLQEPGQVVPTLAYLQRYSAVVLADTPADALSPDLLAQLVPYVRDLGHGLVVTGGQDAYGMGGYGQTPLEQVLPVKMVLPRRKDLPTTAVVLLIEDLEDPTDVNISKEAGKGVVNLLTEQDQVAVNDTPYDGSAGWAVPMQYVRDKRAIFNAITQMEPGDPDSYAPYLQAAYDKLRQTNAAVKHIIVLGDGDAQDSSYGQVVKKIHAAGVTISTVITGGIDPSDFQTMKDIARWGGGRYYRADNSATIPRLMLREGRRVAHSAIIQGKFYPQESSPNPMLSDLHSVPPLFGYVATTPKPAAEVILESQKLDPVLAGWQFGLGRAVAWTSDAAGLWTRQWLQAPGANRFWSNLVSWTLPATGGHLFVSAASAQGQGQVSVDTPPTLGTDPSVTARVVDPSLGERSVQLQPSALGHYRGVFDASSEGSYFVTVQVRGAGHAEVGQVALDVPYSAEYRVAGTNRAFLQELARAGGGSVITRPEDAWADNLAPVWDQRSLTDLLWLLALLLLPVDIGVRRLILSRKDLPAFRAALAHARPAVSEPAMATLGVLRARRSEQRSRPKTTAQVPISPAAEPARRQQSGLAATPPPATPEAASESSESTTGHLLAAKRRRK